MEYILKVLKAEPTRRPNEATIDVTYAIYTKSGEIISTEPTVKRTFGLPQSMTAEEIQVELAKHLNTYREEMAAAANNKAKVEIDTRTAETVKAIGDLEIK